MPRGEDTWSSGWLYTSPDGADVLLRYGAVLFRHRDDGTFDELIVGSESTYGPLNLVNRFVIEDPLIGQTGTLVVTRTRCAVSWGGAKTAYYTIASAGSQHFAVRRVLEYDFRQIPASLFVRPDGSLLYFSQHASSEKHTSGLPIGVSRAFLVTLSTRGPSRIRELSINVGDRGSHELYVVSRQGVFVIPRPYLSGDGQSGGTVLMRVSLSDYRIEHDPQTGMLRDLRRKRGL